jgi:transcriptional regulator with XRE-family HTH domain
MSPIRGPAVPRRRLGAELRRLRDEAGLLIEDVAETLECSTSKISRLENGKGIPKIRDVRDMLARYGVTDSRLRERMLGWARAGQQQGWWQEFSDVMQQDAPHRLDTVLALETDATRSLAFQVSLVHGLLQTEAYARAVIETILPRLSSYDIDRLVELRLRRQQVLYREDDPLEVRHVLDEAVLWRPIGGPHAFAEQLKRILHDTKRSNITVRVLPFVAGVHQAVVGSFEITEFIDKDDHDVVSVSVESLTGNTFLESDNDVTKYMQAFNCVTERALSPAQSADLIKSVLARHEQALVKD